MKNIIIRIGKAYLIGCLIFIIFTGMFAVLLRTTDISEKWILVYDISSFTITCAFISLYTCAYIQKRGIIWGAALSVGYIVVVSCSIWMYFDMQGDILSVTRWIVIPVLSGAIFGIIGANIKKKTS